MSWNLLHVRVTRDHLLLIVQITVIFVLKVTYGASEIEASINTAIHNHPTSPLNSCLFYVALRFVIFG